MLNNRVGNSLLHLLYNIPFTYICSFSRSYFIFIVLLLTILPFPLLRDAGAVYGNVEVPPYYPHEENQFPAEIKQKALATPMQLQQPHQLQGLCPFPCTCRGHNVDCSYRNLRAVPSPFPPNVERINLIGNKITLIKANDFRGLRQLKVLQLANNEIEDILDGAFTDLVKLKKLRLNSNSLKYLRDNLFQLNVQLQKLELKDNELTCIYQNTFNGLKNMRQLQLENNRLA
jgi:Leucine-rich repeat (LRR) protein